MKCGFQPNPWFEHAHAEPAGSQTDDHQIFESALREIAQTKWDGVEISSARFEEYFDRPDEFKALFDRFGLELATYYHAREFHQMTPAEAVEGARRKCEFLKEVGSSVLLLDGGPRTEGGATSKDIKAVADAANAVAEMAAGYGLVAPWHIHWGTVFERSAALDKLMQLTDPALVTLCPDTAQMALGDFDLPAAFEKYADRITYVHFKDLAFLDEQGRRLPEIRPGLSQKGAWGAGREAVVLEPGQGAIDFSPLWNILDSAGFDGWVVVDLDYSLSSPLESARLSREYLGRLIPALGR